jgi:DNA polymerase-3 subunit gamma/tau
VERPPAQRPAQPAPARAHEPGWDPEPIDAAPTQPPPAPPPAVAPPTQAEAPAPAPVAAAPAGAVDAAAVRRIWSEILQSVSRRRRTPHAILMTAEVTDVRDNELVLSFSAAMLGAFQRSQDVDWVLREVLTELLGGSWRITGQVARPGGPGPEASGPPHSSPGGSPSGSPPPPPPADLPSADDEDMPEAGSGGAHDPVALLRHGLGAQVIDERDAG